MGHKDLMSLFPIVQEARRISDEFDLRFSFKWDQGDYETRIDISSLGTCFIGNGKLPLIGFEMYCPDILDYNNKIIIEYEEEAKSNKGAKRRKGHFEGNNRDLKRDWAYTRAKFDLLKVWESDKKWKEKLKQFLIITYAKRKLDCQSHS